MKTDVKSPKAWLEVKVDGDIQPQYVTGGRWVLGRHPDCDTTFDDSHISNEHALIHHDPQSGWSLEDLGSSNGTWLNGKVINAHSRNRLQNQDVIGLAKVVAIKFVTTETVSLPMGHITIDPTNREASIINKGADGSVSETVIALGSSRGFDLLALLCEIPGTAVSKNDLLDAGWPKQLHDPDNPATDDLLKSAMYQLRKKIKAADEDNSIVIESVPGYGYRLSYLD